MLIVHCLASERLHLAVASDSSHAVLTPPAALYLPTTTTPTTTPVQLEFGHIVYNLFHNNCCAGRCCAVKVYSGPEIRPRVH
jgi:hypothetical protein